MNRVRVLIAGVFASVMLILTGASAQAATDYHTCHTYGGVVYNDHDSTASIAIYSSGASSSGCGYGSLPRNYRSDNFYNFRDTDAFYVGANWRCKSQYGYNYYGNVKGTWFWLQSDNVFIALTCTKMPVGSYVSPSGDDIDYTDALPGATPPA
jgi:hypothetical protein